MKTFWQGLAAAAIGGATTGFAGSLQSGQGFKISGMSAAMGALMTVLAYFVKSPLAQPVAVAVVADPAPVEIPKP